MPYIYQAALWCDSCGQAICERLTAEGAAPADPDDEYSYDSDDFPKYVATPGESDSPDHCNAGPDCLEAEILSDGSKVGALLSDELTSVGVEYVKEAVAEGGPVAEFWRDSFSWIDFPSDDDSDDDE